ncbi:MAG: hypothetical protein M3R63_18035 [Actinomycetota bacterium]|nr:hypothetical protein [Actinomycetota bacterium]
MGPLDSFVAEVEVSVVEQVVQVWVEVVGDTTLVVDDQVVADEDDVTPADPTQREQPAQFGRDRGVGSAHAWGPFRSGTGIRPGGWSWCRPVLARRRPSSSP